MKVIKNGSVVPGGIDNWKVEVTCHQRIKREKEGCGAVLEVAKKDLVMMHWFGTHFQHWYTAVRCPQCGKYNAVDVPDPIWQRFNTKKRRARSVFDGVDDSIW